MKVRFSGGFGNRLFCMTYNAHATFTTCGVIACGDAFACTERRAVRKAIKDARKRYKEKTTPATAPKVIQWTETQD